MRLSSVSDSRKSLDYYRTRRLFSQRIACWSFFRLTTFVMFNDSENVVKKTKCKNNTVLSYSETSVRINGI